MLDKHAGFFPLNVVGSIQGTHLLQRVLDKNKKSRSLRGTQSHFLSSVVRWLFLKIKYSQSVCSSCSYMLICKSSRLPLAENSWKCQ